MNSETQTARTLWPWHDRLPKVIAQDVTKALAEDIGSGDLSTAIFPKSSVMKATVVSREYACLCGVDWFSEVFRRLDPGMIVEWFIAEGSFLVPNQTVCQLQGSARALFTGERTALNFLQTLSATATITSHYVKELSDTSCQLLDTRKTLPGLRLAQKYAVYCGGGKNHRLGLHDGILLKENHLAVLGGVEQAIACARQYFPQMPIATEAETLEELEAALKAGADWVLLDDFSLDRLQQARQITPKSIKLEASGGITLENIRSIAETGVDYISVGSLTKHVQAVDFSLRFL